jgi:chemotaxis protein MotB
MRKKKAPEHVNHERWLVSYADFITLLFAFFTTMYAISTVDAQKAGRLVMSMRASFDSPMFTPGSETLSLSKGDGTGASLAKDLVQNIKPSPNMQAGPNLGLKSNLAEKMNPTGQLSALKQLKQKVDYAAAKRRFSGKVRTQIEDRGLVISLDGTFYESGDDQLRPEGRELMEAIAPDIQSLGGQVRIEGHTDNVPIHTARFPSNLELSCARASSIVYQLIANFGFPQESIYPAGWGESKPIADNSTASGRALNRRVEIIVLSSVVTRKVSR